MQHIKGKTNTHAKGVPHARERIGDDVQHADATMQKREVVVAHVSQADVGRVAGAEEARGAKHGGVEDARVAEARLGSDERIEEPCGVGEVGAHARMCRTEEVDEDEVLDRRERRRRRCGGY
jgi:hypothetical protein